MVFKDWLLLLVPIFFNGVIVLVLQKLFEKKQIIRMRKMEYISMLMKKIDVPLELHAKATRLANERDPDNNEEINNTIRQFFDTNLDLYYYYIQNKNIFESLEDSFENLSSLIVKLSQTVNNHFEDKERRISSSINSIRDILLKIKGACIKI